MDNEVTRVSIRGVNHVTFSVADLEAAVRFYVDRLGCSLAARWPTGAYLRAGTLWLALVVGSSETREPHDYSHLALDVAPQDFDIVARRLLDAGVETWQDNWTEGDSLYFCDPDGHRLEIHASTLMERLNTARASPWPGLQILADDLGEAGQEPSL